MTTTSSVSLPGITPYVFQIGMTLSSTVLARVLVIVTLIITLSVAEHTVVHEPDSPVLSCAAEHADFAEQHLRIRPRDRQRRDIGHAGARRARCVLVCGVARCARVAWID